MLKVYKTNCQNCLLSEDRIVSPQRAKEIISKCKRDQTHFICHKSDDVVCNKFYKELGHYSQLVRIAERLKFVQFVDQVEGPKLISYNQIKSNEY